MAQDALGNEVSDGDAITLKGIDDFVTGFLAYETKAGNVMAVADADDGSVLANVYAGFSWMFLEAAGARRMAAKYLRRAEAAGLPNAREALLIEQLRLWISGDIPAVQRIGAELAARWPRDLASVKLDQYFSCINAIVGARLLGVWEEGGIDAGIPETERFAIDPDRAILKRATKLFGRVHQAVQVAAMLPPLPIGCGDKDLKRGVAGSGAHSREAGIDPDCSNWIFCFRRYPGT